MTRRVRDAPYCVLGVGAKWPAKSWSRLCSGGPEGFFGLRPLLWLPPHGSCSFIQADGVQVVLVLASMLATIFVGARAPLQLVFAQASGRASRESAWLMSRKLEGIAVRAGCRRCTISRNGVGARQDGALTLQQAPYGMIQCPASGAHREEIAECQKSQSCHTCWRPQDTRV